MTVHSVVPTLRHHAEIRPFEGFLTASCESRVRSAFTLTGNSRRVGGIVNLASVELRKNAVG